MRKLGLVMTPAFVVALALSAVAQEKQVTTRKENDATVKVNVSGRLALDYVWRSLELEAPVVTLGTAGTGESENTFEGYAAIRFDVELSDKVSVVMEIGTERVDGGGILAWGQATPTGASSAQDVVLREAHILLSDFLTPALSAEIGISTWSFDVRGKGSSFAFDPRHSQSFARNVSTVADVTISTNLPEELQPVGGVLKYTRDAMTFDLVLLPAVIEGGPASTDESLYAADFWYKLDGKGSRVGAILALVHLPPIGGSRTESGVFTLGGGVVLKGLVENLELFGELYFQFGKAAQDTDAEGMAITAGAEFAVQPALKIGGSLTLISGDDDTVATDDSVDTFLSYENVNDLMIIEDMYFGFDWDSNYFAFKAWGEYALSVGGGKDNLILSAILGITRTQEDVEFAGGAEDALGNELDIKARWLMNKQVSFWAGVALLMGSDILEESMGASSDADDSARLFALGTDLRF
jgi:hypothetical protein